MNGTAQVVGVLGATLIGANFWTNERKAIMPVVSGGSQGGRQQASASAAFKRLGVEAATVAVMVIIASASPSAGGLMAAILLGLALVWAFQHYGSGS